MAAVIDCAAPSIDCTAFVPDMKAFSIDGTDFISGVGALITDCMAFTIDWDGFVVVARALILSVFPPSCSIISVMRVLLTGATGQVGWYTSELLVASGHDVVGIGSPGSVKPMPPGVARARGAWTRNEMRMLLEENGALDAVVHLGAPTHIPASWEDPAGTFEAIGALGAELAYALAKRHPGVRLMHASTSNVFGRATVAVLDEKTPIAPASPYGAAKAAAQLAVANAREGFGLHATNVVFFQALSPRASPTLVLRKITRGVAAVLRGEAEHVTLGTMSVVRDMMHARDFAAAIVRLLAPDAPPGDYVCASGRGRTIREMAETACALAGLDPGAVLREDAGYARPNDIPRLVGDATRLRALGWAPRVAFEELVKELLDHDVGASGS
jgi:GDPmannose 4,6-dehydratase